MKKYYNPDDLKKFGSISEFEPNLAKKFFDYYGDVFKDMEKPGDGSALADKYSVEAYPTLIYLQSDGKFIGKAMGFRKSKEFLEMGEQIIAKTK